MRSGAAGGRRPGQRPLRRLPLWLPLLLAAAALAQLAWHHRLPAAQARVETLRAPPDERLLRTLSLGEPATLSRLLALSLQAHDNQPGVSIPLAQLDYRRVIEWLHAALALDPDNPYPLHAAANLYAAVPDRQRVHMIVEFIAAQFVRHPERRWPWMAQAVLLAKHRLGDLPLAYRLAELLARQGQPGAVPGWALQMHIFLLEDLGELESARILLGALVASGVVRDQQELHFLMGRLQALEGALDDENQTMD